MEKKEILLHLKQFIDSKNNTEQNKKTKRILNALENISETDIVIGEEPKYFKAFIECNSTGVGESSFGGTTTQRTVALDYTTDELLFIDGHIGAGVKGLQLFALKAGQTVTYYRKDEIVKAAKQHGFNLHLQSFRDLNFTLTDHRLNRYNVVTTYGPVSYPIRPIMASVNDKGDLCAIGYVYEKDGKEFIIIEPEDITKAGKAENSSGCAPWMFLGFLFPPILIVAGIVMLFKYYKERMIG